MELLKFMQINYILGYPDLKIYQDENLFRFSLDSVLLPNFVTLPARAKRILDIGTGNAVIPIVLSRYTKASIVGVELQKESFLLAQNSIQLNKLEQQITVFNSDIRDYSASLESDQFDVITCNPPYFSVNEGSHFNENETKTYARHEISLDLESIFKISRKLLKNKGNIAIVHRPERLVDILLLMRANGIEPKRIQYVYPNLKKPANILLVEGTKQGKPGIKVLPPLVSHNPDGSYTKELEQFLRS